MKNCVLLYVLFVSCSAFTAEQHVDLMLPGGEGEGFSIDDLPVKPSGDWWVIDRDGVGFHLSRKEVQLKKYRNCGDDDKDLDEWTGRTVEVLGANNPVALIRGYSGFETGSLLAADFKFKEEKNSLNFEFTWDDQPASVRYLVDRPNFTERPQSAGKYSVQLAVNRKEYVLYVWDDWDGEGDLELQWVGDLNRDGAPDVLLNTSVKYSVRTTRLFMSQSSEGAYQYFEVAKFDRSAC